MSKKLLDNSHEVLLSYIEGLKVYLSMKGINDFTKFDSAIIEDKFTITKWDYPPNVEKPTLQQIPQVPNVYARSKVTKPITLYYIIDLPKAMGNNFYVVNTYKIKLDNGIRVENQNQISIQITVYQNAITNITDDVVGNIRRIELLNNGTRGQELSIEILVFRPVRSGWSHQHQAYLTITILPSPIQHIPIPTVMYTH